MQAEGHDGELGESTLHSLLVKKLADKQVESCSRWLMEQKCEMSVLTLRDWLKEEVKIRVEAVEMSHGIDLKTIEGSGAKSKIVKGGRSRALFTSDKGQLAVRSRPPCACCSGNHGI